jgi:hypothetical protein
MQQSELKSSEQMRWQYSGKESNHNESNYDRPNAALEKELNKIKLENDLRDKHLDNEIRQIKVMEQLRETESEIQQHFYDSDEPPIIDE